VHAPVSALSKRQSGAVTVDWVVLAGAVVGIGLASAAAVRTGVVDLGADIATSLSGASVAALPELGSDGAYEHALLNVSQTTYDEWLRTLSLLDAQQLVNVYRGIGSIVPEHIASGSAHWAGYYIDLMAATQQTLDALGVARPDGTPAVSDLVNRYHEVFG